METVIGYIVIFGLGIIFVSFYLFKKDRKRDLPISEQPYPQIIMTVFIKKEKGKLSEIILQLRSLKNVLHIRYFHLELTNEQHEKETIDLKPILEIVDETIDLKPAQPMRFSFSSTTFVKLLSSHSDTYDRFRFVVATPENKKFKSHTLGLNKRWGLFKQDSGWYN